MKKSSSILGVSIMFAMVLALKTNAQYASDNIRNYASQQRQLAALRQLNVHHNKLTSSNKNLLASNNISRNNIEQKIPANMRSRFTVHPQNNRRVRPEMLASNSPKIKQKPIQKRPPALPVVF